VESSFGAGSGAARMALALRQLVKLVHRAAVRPYEIVRFCTGEKLLSVFCEAFTVILLSRACGYMLTLEPSFGRRLRKQA
jgi:hypothetical protein